MTDLDQIKILFNQRLQEVNKLVEETNKTSVLVIQQFPIDSDVNTLIPNVRESLSNILAFVELGNISVLKEVLELADGIIDNIVVDSDIKCEHSKKIVEFAKENIKSSKKFYYSDNNTWADSAINFLQQISEGVYNKNILLAGQGTLFNAVKRKLSDYQPNYVSLNHNSPVDLIIGASIKNQSIGIEQIPLVSADTKIYDVGIGNFSHDFLKASNKIGASVYRIDIRAGISSSVLNILETDYLISNVMGEAQIKDTHIVAGGAMGGDGAIIVDDINHPSHVIGVADGKGNIKNKLSKEDQNKIGFVKRLINLGK